MNLEFLTGAIFNADLGEYKFLETIVKFLNEAIIPITITLTVAAAVFSICLAFAIIKAESGEKAEELKKRMIGLIVTFVIIIASVWILGWVLSNFSAIMGAFRSMGSGL